VYEKESGVYNINGKNYNESEYQQWRLQLREIDHVINLVIFKRQPGNDSPNHVNWQERKTYSDNEAEELIAPLQATHKEIKHTTHPKIEADKAPVIACNDILQPKRSGKLSELGDTWELSENIFYKRN